MTDPVHGRNGDLNRPDSRLNLGSRYACQPSPGEAMGALTVFVLADRVHVISDGAAAKD